MVSYQNGAFVLDLTGLGSELVRRLRMAQAFGAAQMAEITAHYDIGLVVVYESWFSSVPATWRRIAVMHAEYITAARGDVSFFVTPTADLKRVSQSLAEFKSSLPRRVTLEINQL